MAAGIIITLLIVIPMCVMWGIGIDAERKHYNHGVCPCCKTRLKLFDHDSQGGRGYVCEQCGYTTWVSYPSIDGGNR